MIARRTFWTGAATLAFGTAPRAAEAKIVRIGTQKGGPILMAERQQRGLETLLAPMGVEVKWVEFQFGPPIMEALRIGAIDIGFAGDAPPIFAQAAKGDLVYLAAVPASAEGILLPAGSTLQSLAELKGKRVAFARGSSAHNLTIAAVEKAGLNFADIVQTPLAPADAAAALERGAVDAWVVWDPYYALYETRPNVRVLATSDGIAPQNSFILGSRAFAEANPGLISKILADLARISDWALTNKHAVAELVSTGTGVPYEPTLRALNRYPFRVLPIGPDHIASQQDIADRFHRLGVIPSKLDISAWTWHKPA